MMAKAKKELKPTVEETGIQRLMARMAAKHANVMTATEAMRRVRYMDFMDPHTGLPSITQEYLIGARGFLAGRMTQLRATYSKGKSSFCLLQYAAAQKSSDAYCLHIETEGAMAPADRIAMIGADPDSLLQSECSSLEDCCSMIDELVCEIRGGFGGSIGDMGRTVKTKYTDPIDPGCDAPIIIGVDSLSALGKEERVQQDVADVGKVPQVGQTAKMLREYFRNRIQRFNQKQVALFLTTQETVKLEMGMKAFAGPQKTSVAAEAIGIHATFGIDFDSAKWLDKNRGEQIGDILKLKTFKNKWSPRNRAVELYLTTNNGFDLIHTDAEFLLNHPASPFSGNSDLFSGDKLCYRHSAGITCKPLSDKSFKTEEEFVRAFYENKDMLQAIRNDMKIRGFGFDWETAATGLNESGELSNEVDEPDLESSNIEEI